MGLQYQKQRNKIFSSTIFEISAIVVRVHWNFNKSTKVMFVTSWVKLNKRTVEEPINLPLQKNYCNQGQKTWSIPKCSSKKSNSNHSHSRESLKKSFAASQTQTWLFKNTFCSVLINMACDLETSIQFFSFHNNRIFIPRTLRTICRYLPANIHKESETLQCRISQKSRNSPNNFFSNRCEGSTNYILDSRISQLFFNNSSFSCWKKKQTLYKKWIVQLEKFSENWIDWTEFRLTDRYVLSQKNGEIESTQQSVSVWEISTNQNSNASRYKSNVWLMTNNTSQRTANC